MLLADYIYTSLIQSFNLVAIGCLQGREDSNVTGLELVGGMRGETTQDYIIFETNRASRSRRKSALVVSG